MMRHHLNSPLDAAFNRQPLYVLGGKSPVQWMSGVKAQKSSFPFCHLWGEDEIYHSIAYIERWAEDQTDFSKFLTLLSCSRKLTFEMKMNTHEMNSTMKNIQNVGSVFSMISPVCFVLHIVELPMILHGSRWSVYCKRQKVVSTSGYCPLQQANPVRCWLYTE